MNLNWLEDFVCLAHTLSFTRAAQERNVTQSAFSRRIRSLESWAGMELIDRGSHPARLSPAGEDFLPAARSVVRQMLRARDDLRTRDRDGMDFLNFAAPHSVSIHHLMPFLHELERRLPGLRTRVASDNLHMCCRFLSEGLCEFLMCYRHDRVPLTLDEARFSRIDLERQTMAPVCVAAASGDGPRWTLPGPPSGPAPYLAFASDSFLGAVMEHELGSRRAVLNVRHTDALAEALKSLALQGAGVAWLPLASVESELRGGRLRRVGGDEWNVDLTLSLFAEPDRLGRRGSKIWRFFQERARS